jgi:acyl-CoA thioester hydrolase
MYTKSFDIRWSDLDANRHFANASYLNFMSHTRMGFLMECGFNQESMAQYQLGPVVFYEHIYYFKEAFAGKPIQVSLELKGLSKDGMFFEFHHNFYDHKGKNFAHCEMMGAWIDMKSRALAPLPEVFLNAFAGIEKADGFKVLTKEDTRKFAKKPIDKTV